MFAPEAYIKTKIALLHFRILDKRWSSMGRPDQSRVDAATAVQEIEDLAPILGMTRDFFLANFVVGEVVVVITSMIEELCYREPDDEIIELVATFHNAVAGEEVCMPGSGSWVRELLATHRSKRR